MTRPTSSNARPSSARAVAVPSPLGSFDADITRVVLQLRAALAGVFAALGKPIRGGTDLQREFGLPSTLSWQLHAFVNSIDPIAAAAQIPGRQATRRALAAAAAKGVPADVIDRAAVAFDDFESFVERHSGSRATFASIIASRKAGADGSFDDSSGINLKARRDAFRATSHIYGVQAGAAFMSSIIHPGDFPDRYDFVLVSGYVGLRVTRPFDKLFLCRHGHKADAPITDVPAARAVADPYDDPDGAQGIPLLTGFSSSPLPQFSSASVLANRRELYISGPPVGRTGELTICLAEHWPGAVPHNEDLNFDATIVYPTEFFFQDVLLAPGICPLAPTRPTHVFGGVLDEIRHKQREVDRLHVPAQCLFTGVGADSLQTPAVPRYTEMLRYVLTRLGWDPQAFDTYRCQMEYPVLHSLLNCKFPREQTTDVPD